jgi:hypothetical protein
MATQQEVATDITLALALVQTVMGALPQTAPFAPLIGLLAEAATKLAQNIGTDVTYSNLEGLRVKAQ